MCCILCMYSHNNNIQSKHIYYTNISPRSGSGVTHLRILSITIIIVTALRVMTKQYGSRLSHTSVVRPVHCNPYHVEVSLFSLSTTAIISSHICPLKDRSIKNSFEFPYGCAPMASLSVKTLIDIRIQK